ncbi:MAG: halo transducer protein [Halobacteriales archaeon]
MGQEDAADRDGIAGQPVEAAVDYITATRDEDPQEVRAVLDRIAEDGAVSWAALDAELADASKIVSTPETRTELAAIALSDAREAAAAVADLDIVQSRLQTFESRLESIQAAVEDLGSDLQQLVQRVDAEDDLYLAARELTELIARANQLQRSADELSVDLEEFEEWLERPEHRFDELEADVDALAASLDELRTELEDFENPSCSASPSATSDSALAWVESFLHHRTLSLFLADLRTELVDLRTWSVQEGLDTERPDAIEERIEDLADQWATIESDLEAIAPATWQSEHAERLAKFERVLDDFSPPIDWNAVYAELDAHRP